VCVWGGQGGEGRLAGGFRHLLFTGWQDLTTNQFAKQVGQRMLSFRYGRTATLAWVQAERTQPPPVCEAGWVGWELEHSGTSWLQKLPCTCSSQGYQDYRGGAAGSQQTPFYLLSSCRC
jgi:hypothetical protein